MDRQPRLWISRPLFPDVVDGLARHFEVHAEPIDRPVPATDVASRLGASDAAIVGMHTRIDDAAIANAARLRFVATLSVGYDNLDLAALTAAGIGASNTPGVLDDSVADYAWGLLISAARRIGAAERFVRAGSWRQSLAFMDWLGQDISGRTLGILGMGRIGRAIARRAGAFRMPVLYHNRHRLDPEIERACNAARYVDFATLLAQSDALLLVVPRTPATHHLIGTAELARMKPTAVLVNIGRGGIVDEAALAAALASGRIAAAALDVFEDEPAVEPALFKCDNVVLSPHLASASYATRHAIAATAADNVLACFGFGDHAGKPPNLLNPDALARCRQRN
jgi:gluconate 2-dehydrogenase